jgi:hypothetical protein
MVDPLPLQRPANEGNLVSFDDIGVTSPSNGTFFDRQQTSFNVNGGSDQSGALRRFHSLRTDIQNKIVSSFLIYLYFLCFLVKKRIAKFIFWETNRDGKIKQNFFLCIIKDKRVA